MSKKGIPRSKQHEWQPDPADEAKVICQKCNLVVAAVAARRGIGACSGTEGESGTVPERSVIVDLPQTRPFIASGEDHGNCNACGYPLRELPLNSRLGMIACTYIRCNFYRQRLRTFVLPD